MNNCLVKASQSYENFTNFPLRSVVNSHPESEPPQKNPQIFIQKSIYWYISKSPHAINAIVLHFNIDIWTVIRYILLSVFLFYPMTLIEQGICVYIKHKPEK